MINWLRLKCQSKIKIAACGRPQLAIPAGQGSSSNLSRINLPAKEQVLPIIFKNHDFVFSHAFVFGVTKLILK